MGIKYLQGLEALQKRNGVKENRKFQMNQLE